MSNIASKSATKSTIDQLHRPEAAAAFLGVSVATLWRLVRAGRLRVVRVLGHPRFTTDDLAALREPIA